MKKEVRNSEIFQDSQDSSRWKLKVGESQQLIYILVVNKNRLQQKRSNSMESRKISWFFVYRRELINLLWVSYSWNQEKTQASLELF